MWLLPLFWSYLLTVQYPITSSIWMAKAAWRVSSSSAFHSFGRLLLLDSHVILHLPQFAHHVHRIRLPCCFLHSRVLRGLISGFSPNEEAPPRVLTSTRIKTLYCCHGISQWPDKPRRVSIKRQKELYLLITNRKFTLRLLIVLRELLQILDRLRLEHRGQELDVLLRIFMSRLFCRYSSCCITKTIRGKLT